MFVLIRLQEPPSPNTVRATSGAKVAARRLSSQSIHPFTMSASPSTSLLRSTPPPNQPGSLINRPSSIGRTSSFLSQSGRSFSHAQIANMYGDSTLPIVMGHMSGDGLPVGSSPPIQTPASPSSLSFSKQPIPRSLSGRPPFATSYSSSPFIPGSLERDSSTIPFPPNVPPQIIKRYSSSLSQRQGHLTGSAGSSGQPGETGSPSCGDGASLPSSVNVAAHGLSRRIPSQESGLRHSLDGGARDPQGPDEEEIQAFLKTLDQLPQPPSLAAQAAHASRSHLPSTSSSRSSPSVPASPGASAPRISMTKAQVDDTLRRMAGNFNRKSATPSESASDLCSPASKAFTATAGPSSVGLLTASRPRSAARRVSATEADSSSRPGFRRQTSGGSRLAGRNESSRTTARLAISPLKASMTTNVPKPATARSLPGPLAPLTGETAPNLRSGRLNPLSPQTTGGMSTATNESTSTRTSRRGPVLLRGGFGEQRPSSSPSHSPIRQRVMAERQSEDESNGSRPVPARGMRGAAPVITGMCYGTGGRTAGQRTAPGSLGAEGEVEVQERRRGREGRVVSEGEREVQEVRRGHLSGDW